MMAELRRMRRGRVAFTRLEYMEARANALQLGNAEVMYEMVMDPVEKDCLLHFLKSRAVQKILQKVPGALQMPLGQQLRVMQLNPEVHEHLKALKERRRQQIPGVGDLYDVDEMRVVNEPTPRHPRRAARLVYGTC